MFKNISSLITGGAQGLGKAFAESVLEAGAKVSLLDIAVDRGRELEAELKNKYGQDRVMFLKCDVTNSKDLREAFQKTYDQFKGLDLLVNNAGTVTLQENQWRDTFNVNLISLTECCYLGREYMTKSPRDQFFGHIVNISSAGGLTPMAVDPIYSASKYGVVGLSRSLAMRWAQLKIRVNCFCPTFVDTDLFKINAEVNKEYAEVLDSMPMLKTSDVARIFNQVVFEDNNTTGEVLHISTEGIKRMTKKVNKL